MGYNWRKPFGIHVQDRFTACMEIPGICSFDPAAQRLDVLDRTASQPSRASGMYDQFTYGYLGFTLGPDE